MNSLKEENDEICWEDILVRLNTYARSLLNKYRWFRVGQVSTQSGEEFTYIAGQEARDYVLTAIEKYLRNPEKWDASKGDLVDYLKYNLVRSLVWNDVNSKENITTITSYKNDSEENDAAYIDRIAPLLEAHFETEIDFKTIMLHIQEEVAQDEIAEIIFLGKITGSPRREIIAEFSLSESDYNNGVRRLDTILKSAAKKYNLRPRNA